MSYLTQAQLTTDGGFQSRSHAALTQQAQTQFLNDADAANAATAAAVLTGNAAVVNTFVQCAAAGPGIADKVDNGDGTIDQSKVTDADLLSLTQANWPTVAALYFDADGSPKP